MENPQCHCKAGYFNPNCPYATPYEIQVWRLEVEAEMERMQVV